MSYKPPIYNSRDLFNAKIIDYFDRVSQIEDPIRYLNAAKRGKTLLFPLLAGTTYDSEYRRLIKHAIDQETLYNQTKGIQGTIYSPYALADMIIELQQKYVRNAMVYGKDEVTLKFKDVNFKFSDSAVPERKNHTTKSKNRSQTKNRMQKSWTNSRISRRNDKQKYKNPYRPKFLNTTYNQISYMETKLQKFKDSTKGAIDPIDGIIMFIIAAVVIYIMFPILAGVETATPTIADTSPLFNASATSQSTIGSGATLLALVVLVIAAVVILATIMKLRN